MEERGGSGLGKGGGSRCRGGREESPKNIDQYGFGEDSMKKILISLCQLVLSLQWRNPRNNILLGSEHTTHGNLHLVLLQHIVVLLAGKGLPLVQLLGMLLLLLAQQLHLLLVENYSRIHLIWTPNYTENGLL